MTYNEDLETIAFKCFSTQPMREALFKQQGMMQLKGGAYKDNRASMQKTELDKIEDFRRTSGKGYNLEQFRERYLVNKCDLVFESIRDFKRYPALQQVYFLTVRRTGGTERATRRMGFGDTVATSTDEIKAGVKWVLTQALKVTMGQLTVHTKAASALSKPAEADGYDDTLWKLALYFDKAKGGRALWNNRKKFKNDVVLMIHIVTPLKECYRRRTSKLLGNTESLVHAQALRPSSELSSALDPVFPNASLKCGRQSYKLMTGEIMNAAQLSYNTGVFMRRKNEKTGADRFYGLKRSDLTESKDYKRASWGDTDFMEVARQTLGRDHWVNEVEDDDSDSESEWSGSESD